MPETVTPTLEQSAQKVAAYLADTNRAIGPAFAPKAHLLERIGVLK